MKLIERTQYLEELESLINTPDVKIITGVRRSGKSKLMDAFIEKIKQNNPSANIIHVNFNITKYEELMEYHVLEN